MPNYVANMIDFSNTDKAVFDRICAFMNTENDNSVEDGVLFDFNRLVPMPESLNIECGSNTEVGKDLAYIMDDGAFDERRQYDSARLLHLMETEGITSQNRPFFTGAEAKQFTQNTEIGRLLLQLGRTAIQNLEKYDAETWYDWRVSHWATKWNAAEVCIDADSQQIRFDTAWSFPEPIAYALAKKFPEVDFVWTYADEDYGHNAGCFEKTGDEVFFDRYENCSDAAYETYANLWEEEPWLNEEED